MSYDATSTDRHRRNNDRQLLVFKRQRPDLYARLVSELSPEAQHQLEARLVKMEAEEAEEQASSA